MTSRHRFHVVPFAAAFVLATSLAAQNSSGPPIDLPATSPAATLKQRIALTDIEVSYSRPSMKGRAIFGGGIIAYGDVWRTGANSATRLTFSTPVKLEGHDVAAGEYELFTIPGKDEWVVILQKASRQWGAYGYKPENDLFRTKVKPTTLTEPMETFTIDFTDVRDQSASLILSWEKTRVPIRLTFEVTEKVMAQVKAALANGGMLTGMQAFRVATFYYDNDLDPKQALAWADLAVKEDGKAPYKMLLKARLHARLGQKDEAKAAALKTVELGGAFEDPNSPYITMARDLITALR